MSQNFFCAVNIKLQNPSFLTKITVTVFEAHENEDGFIEPLVFLGKVHLDWIDGEKCNGESSDDSTVG